MSSVRHFFSNDEHQKLISAIAEAESHTSGEIRIHLAEKCHGDPVAEAKKVFARLGMHRTEERNGVLLFIAPGDHKVAIIGDEGIHAKVGAGFWDEMIHRLVALFREGKHAAAVAACVVECGAKLGQFFPRRKNDKDELSNELSF